MGPLIFFRWFRGSLEGSWPCISIFDRWGPRFTRNGHTAAWPPAHVGMIDQRHGHQVQHLQSYGMVGTEWPKLKQIGNRVTRGARYPNTMLSIIRRKFRRWTSAMPKRKSGSKDFNDEAKSLVQQHIWRVSSGKKHQHSFLKTMTVNKDHGKSVDGPYRW